MKKTEDFYKGRESAMVGMLAYIDKIFIKGVNRLWSEC